MDVLLDINILIDFLLKREGYRTAKRVYSSISQSNSKMWMAASTVDNFYYVIHSEAKRLTELNGEEWTDRAKKEIENLFYNFMEKVSIYTVEPKSIRKALSKKGDIEDEIIYTNFKRIAPKGVIVSNDKGFQKYPDAISPAEFLEKYKNAGHHLSSIPLLDLQEAIPLYA